MWGGESGDEEKEREGRCGGDGRRADGNAGKGIAEKGMEGGEGGKGVRRAEKEEKRG